MGYRYNPFTGDFDRVDTTSVPDEYVNQFDADTGTAIPLGHVINLFGDSTQGLVTAASGDTVSFTNLDATESQKGVGNLATDLEAIAGTVSTNSFIVPTSLKAKLGSQTSKGIAFGAGDTASIAWTSGLDDGQIVIGSTAGIPAVGAITSLAGTISITLGPNTINLETDDSVAISYTTDSGSAVPALGILQILGGTGCSTSGATNVVTLNLDATVPLSFPTNSGTAIPALNALTIVGIGSIRTSASGATVTIASTNENSWINQSTSTTITSNTNYFVTAGATLTFPAAPIQGDTIIVQTTSAITLVMDANSGQFIRFGTQLSSSGGTLTNSPTNAGDTMTFTYRASDSTWYGRAAVGNWGAA
jgi:hypothetical protein